MINIMKIVLRACDKNDTCSGVKRPPFVTNKEELLKKCAKSLLNFSSCDEVFVFGDNLKPEMCEFYKSTLPNLSIFNTDHNLGNSGTFKRAIKFVRESSFNDNEIFLFTEDDYFYLNQKLDKTLDNFYKDVRTKYNIPCFFHPTDYPDRYFDRGDLKLRILLNNDIGYFREIKYTTFTYICKLSDFKKMLYFIDIFVNNIPVNMCVDGLFSSIFHVEEALCFSPIPTMAAHLHETTLPYFVDWESEYKKVTI
jgi:hypothetical protein